jgi:1-acyl-sn-glycerol-3-phosphate acyltransferase
MNTVSCYSLPAWSERQLSKLLGIKFEVRGYENIVQDSGCIVLMNHQSALDILGELCCLSLTNL